MTRPNLHVSQHPAVLHKLAILRDERTEPKKFREVVRELSWLLGYEALADVRTQPLKIRTPSEEMEAAELADRIGPGPTLRAGRGLVGPVAGLVPSAPVFVFAFHVSPGRAFRAGAASLITSSPVSSTASGTSGKPSPSMRSTMPFLPNFGSGVPVFASIDAR